MLFLDIDSTIPKICGHCNRSLCHYCATHHRQIVFERCSTMEHKIFGKIRDYKEQKLSLELSYEETLTKITKLELALRSMVKNRIATLTDSCNMTKLVKCAQYRCQLELLKEISIRLSKARTLLVFDKEFVNQANKVLKEAEQVLKDDSKWCHDYAIDLEVNVSNITRIQSEIILTGDVLTLPLSEEKQRDLSASQKASEKRVKRNVSTQTCPADFPRKLCWRNLWTSSKVFICIGAYLLMVFLVMEMF
ncbi:uncharacterized protein LOC142340026 [Convolutriloba macropyga]|uniref:uncharacterized protein LOC142340026 n=1 Tax=Convolutriloba macropyga TaxID=536237 RepID=UPI003F51C7F9